MKNLSLNQQYTLFYKIQEIHDKIYKLPANRFIFSAMEIMTEYTGGLPFYYEIFEGDRYIIHKNKRKEIKLLRFKHATEFNYSFGDQLVVYYFLFNHDDDIKVWSNTITNNSSFPTHKGIFIQCNYKCKNHMLNTLFDSLKSYNETMDAVNNEIMKRQMPTNVYFKRLLSLDDLIKK